MKIFFMVYSFNLKAACGTKKTAGFYIKTLDKNKLIRYTHYHKRIIMPVDIFYILSLLRF